MDGIPGRTDDSIDALQWTNSPKTKQEDFSNGADRVPFKDRFKGPFKGPFKGRNRAASAEQLEVMQSYNSQETPIFFYEKPKFQQRENFGKKSSGHCDGF